MGFCRNHDWWWWRLVILEFYIRYKDHSGFITINTLLYLSQIFIRSRQFSRWKGSLILLWNQRRRRKRRNQEKDKTSKEFYSHVEIIQMKSDNNVFFKKIYHFLSATWLDNDHLWATAKDSASLIASLTSL